MYRIPSNENFPVGEDPHPAGRAAAPHDVVPPLLWLASELAPGSGRTGGGGDAPPDALAGDLEQARADGVRLVYHHRPVDDPLDSGWLARRGGRALTASVLYEKPLDAGHPPVPDGVVAETATEVSPALRALAPQCGRYSRFRVDPGVGFRFTVFRALRRELAESVFTYTLNFTFLDGLFAWNTERIGYVPARQVRAEGESGYSLSKLLLLSLNMLTNFSLVPLQLGSRLGLAAAGLGLGAFHLFQTIQVPGYASIIVAVLALGGVQLLALGIIGESLGRVHLDINRKPQYLERHVLAGRES